MEQNTVTAILDGLSSLLLKGKMAGVERENGNSMRYESLVSTVHCRCSQYGKRQAFGLGKSLKAFYGTFINENYLSSQARFYSASVSRSQSTMQVIFLISLSFSFSLSLSLSLSLSSDYCNSCPSTGCHRWSLRPRRICRME